MATVENTMPSRLILKLAVYFLILIAVIILIITLHSKALHNLTTSRKKVYLRLQRELLEQGSMHVDLFNALPLLKTQGRLVPCEGGLPLTS